MAAYPYISRLEQSQDLDWLLLGKNGELFGKIRKKMKL